MRVAIYARCSTVHQSTDGQTEALRDYCKARGWEITREYVDTGISGAKEYRPQLNELMADARKRRFDAVLVWKLDRFARSLRHLVTALAEFESLGIAFVSYSDNLDLSTPTGRLMFAVIGAMAEFERALIRERVQAGVRRAQAKGVKFGRRVVEPSPCCVCGLVTKPLRRKMCRACYHRARAQPNTRSAELSP